MREVPLDAADATAYKCISIEFVIEARQNLQQIHSQKLATSTHLSQPIHTYRNNTPQHARPPRGCALLDKNIVVELGHGVAIDQRHHLYSDVGECVVPDSICFCLLTNNHVTRSES